jgi:hypothetical protein
MNLYNSENHCEMFGVIISKIFDPWDVNGHGVCCTLPVVSDSSWKSCHYKRKEMDV